VNSDCSVVEILEPPLQPLVELLQPVGHLDRQRAAGRRLAAQHDELLAHLRRERHGDEAVRQPLDLVPVVFVEHDAVGRAGDRRRRRAHHRRAAEHIVPHAVDAADKQQRQLAARHAAARQRYRAVSEPRTGCNVPHAVRHAQRTQRQRAERLGRAFSVPHDEQTRRRHHDNVAVWSALQCECVGVKVCVCEREARFLTSARNVVRMVSVRHTSAVWMRCACKCTARRGDSPNSLTMHSHSAS
jgi:hypothetical protein